MYREWWEEEEEEYRGGSGDDKEREGGNIEKRSKVQGRTHDDIKR